MVRSQYTQRGLDGWYLSDGFKMGVLHARINANSKKAGTTSSLGRGEPYLYSGMIP